MPPTPPPPLADRAFGARNLPRLVLKSGHGPEKDSWLHVFNFNLIATWKEAKDHDEYTIGAYLEAPSPPYPSVLLIYWKMLGIDWAIYVSSYVLLHLNYI